MVIAGVALPWIVVADDGFAIPLVVDFDDPDYVSFYEYIASRIGGHLAEGGFKVVTSQEVGNCRIVNGNVGGPADVHATFAEVTSRFFGAEESTLMHGAGIAIRYSDEPRQFLALLVGDSDYALIAFNDGTVTQRVTGPLPEGAAINAVRIGARESADGAEFFIDGTSVGKLTDNHIRGWGVALLHCGPGSYTFDNWGLNSTGDTGVRGN